MRRRAGAPPSWVRVGIGDDAAVLDRERGTADVVTTDSLVEGIHFRRDWTSAAAIGHKALAVNLSDLAAMGAVPRAVLLSLVLPPELPLADFDALIDGFLTLAAQERVTLVGGNLARSPAPVVIDVTAIGSVHPRRVLTRAGRPGDALYVTGAIGAAAAGLARLLAGVDRASLDADAAACVARYERPEPRVRCGVQMSRNRAASAAVDLSDGLADAARQLAAASRCGVVLDADRLPIHAGARAWAAAAAEPQDAVAFALAGGEDYELLFAVGKRQHRSFLAVASRCGVPVTLVGRLSVEKGEWLTRSGRIEPLSGGFNHF